MLDWINSHIPPWFYIAFVVHGVTLGTVAYLILLERKVASWAQDRIGPNRVGLGGLAPLLLMPIMPFVNTDKLLTKLNNMKMLGFGQPLADGLKFIVKEDYRPKNVDKILFTLAPIIMIAVIIVSICTIPWAGWKQSTHSLKVGQTAADVMPPGSVVVSQTASDVTYKYPFQIANLNIGVLFILAVLSLSIYGVVIGGWASNNKYSFLGGLRATANMISYEVPLGLCVLCIILMFGTLDLSVIVERQTHYWLGIIPAWNVFTQPLAFLMFLICIHAEANRAPFDVAEAEQELVGGYHTEYSAMRFALFFLAEYAGMITTSCVLVALFFGGWHLPWLEWIPFFSQTAPGADKSVTLSFIVCVIRAFVLFGKAIVVLFVFMWVRWSLPRFRFDQVMQLAWRGLIPISVALVVMTTLLVYISHGSTLDGVDGRTAIEFILANVIVLIVTMISSRLLPAAPNTNRKIAIPGSRYTRASVSPIPVTP